MTSRIIALVLRPLLIVAGTTGLAHLLIGSALPMAGAVDTYPGWVLDVVPLEPWLGDALLLTAELALAALVVAALAGVALWVAGRPERLAGTVRATTMGLFALAGPGFTVLVLLLAERLGWDHDRATLPLAGDPAAGMVTLLVPALAVGLPLAATVSAVLTEQRPYHPTMTAPSVALASRSGSGSGWRIGAPLGFLAAGLMSAELTLARPGLFALLPRSLVDHDGNAALRLIALLALGGAVVGLLVDLVNLQSRPPGRPGPSGLRLSGADSRPPWLPLAIALAAAAVVGLIAVVGLAVGPVASDPSRGPGGPLRDGALLGTDSAGRDILAVTAAALPESVSFALVPSAVAAAAGLGLVLLWRRWPRIGHVVPGAVVDIGWWSIPILLLVAESAFRPSDGLLDPRFLALTALALVPHALRLFRHEDIRGGSGSLHLVAGGWLLLAGYAFIVHVAASQLGAASDPASPTLGLLLAGAASDQATPLSAVLTVTAVGWLTVAALLGLGSSLIRLGWYRAAVALTSLLPADDASSGLLSMTSPLPAAGATAGWRSPEQQPAPRQRQPPVHRPPSIIDDDTTPIERTW